jgi:hypothetical protein
MSAITQSKRGVQVARWPAPGWWFVLSGLLLGMALYLHQPGRVQIGAFLFCWVTALALFLAACWQVDQQRSHPPLSIAWNRLDRVWLLVGLILALSLRLINLADAPQTLHNDEAIMGVNALRLLGQPLADPAAIDSNGYVYLWYYILGLSVRLFGETVAGLRTVPALLGVLTIPAAYLFFRLLFPQRIAVVTSLLLAGFHFHIHFSRLALNNVADPLLGMLLFTCLVVGWRTQRLLFFALAGTLLGLGLYLYTGARLFFPLLGLAALLWMVTHRTTWQQWRRQALVAALVLIGAVVLVAAPIGQNIRHDPKPFTTRFQRDGLNLAKLQQSAAEQQVAPYQVLLAQIQHAALAFHYYADVDVGGFYDRKQPLLGPVAGALMLLGLGVCLSGWRRWPFQLPLVWLGLTILLGGVLMLRPPSVQRYITLAPVLCLLIALGIDLLFQAGNRYLPNDRHLWRWAAALLIVVVAAESLHRYFFDYLQRESYGTRHSQAMTLLTEYLHTLQPSPTVVYVGKQTQSYRFSHIPRYILGDYLRFGLLDPHNPEPQLATALAQDLASGEQCFVFVARPANQVQLQPIQEAYPNGESVPLNWPQSGEQFFQLYQVGCHQ